MKYSVFGISIACALLAASPALSQASAAPASASMTMQQGTPLPAVRHLVYRFGYNAKATKEGNGTGTTTIDIVGLAKDGGMTVTATDNWWNSVNPRQTYTCEVYANGGVNCAHRPNALSPIQVTILPLLGQHYFKALAGGPNSTWQQSYKVYATFSPSSSGGFAGQPVTWNGTSALTGKGTVQNDGKPVVSIHATGALKQQGGRYITANQKSSMLYDPRLKIPVYQFQDITFVPRLTTNHYTVELKLINYSTTANP
jgi:hypothetical protein